MIPTFIHTVFSIHLSCCTTKKKTKTIRFWTNKCHIKARPLTKPVIHSQNETKTTRAWETFNTHLALFIQASYFITNKQDSLTENILMFSTSGMPTNIWTKGESRKERKSISISRPRRDFGWRQWGEGLSSYPWFHYHLDDGNSCRLETESLQLILSHSHTQITTTSYCATTALPLTKTGNAVVNTNSHTIN